MKTTKVIRPAAVSVGTSSASRTRAARLVTGGLPTIKEMMKPFLPPCAPVKGWLAGAR